MAQIRFLRASRIASSSIGRALPAVFVMTDPERLPAEAVMALSLPADWGVIYRHFGAPDRVKTAIALARYCSGRRLRLSISNDPELALAVSASGVHWPEAHASLARRWRGRFDFMTMSWHRGKPIVCAPPAIDAAIVSTVFPSVSQSAGRPIGAVRARTLARLSQLPVYALGGVTAEHAGRVSTVMGMAGIDGFRVFGTVR